MDKSNFRQFILESPEQFEDGLELARDIKLDEKFDNITISGMGGSALPGNLLRSYSNSLFKVHKEYKPFEIYLNRYYSLPPESYTKNHLNLFLSYSGNTEETISSMKEALKASLPSIAISSGGELEKLAKENNISHVKLPIPYPNFQPRISTGYFFSAVFRILINQNLLPDTRAELIKSADFLSQNMSKWESQGKALAKKLKGKIPIIYAGPKYKPVSMIWKIKFNENAKSPAFWNFFPELNHNEMVGFTNPQGKFFVIMLEDELDTPRNKKRYNITAELLAEKGVESEKIHMEGNDFFEKMFASLTLADWSSYYLALEYNVDPTPVVMVEHLKEMLNGS